jgi:hypothetical protein
LTTTWRNRKAVLLLLTIATASYFIQVSDLRN